MTGLEASTAEGPASQRVDADWQPVDDGPLTGAARLVESVVADFFELVEAWSIDGLDDPLTARQVLARAADGLGQVRERLDDLIGDAMGGYRVVVEGHGQVERHAKKSRTRWDKDALYRAVLDTRLVDGETGEVLDPTPLDKVLHVWNLGVPRLTALRARGIDPDEYAEVETRPGWALKIG